MPVPKTGFDWFVLGITWQQYIATCFCTFPHPNTRGSNFTMGTSIEKPIGQISVFVDHMRQKCLEFCQFKFSKMFLSWGDCPVKVTYTGFLPSSNNFTSLFLTEFCQHLLNFWKICTLLVKIVFRLQFITQAESQFPCSPSPNSWIILLFGLGDKGHVNQPW